MDKENAFVVRQSPKRPARPGVLGPVNDPRESDVLREIQVRRESMGKWRGKTPTGKALPGGRKTRRVRRSKKTQRRRR
jgi:hypothetical protein